MSLFRYLWYVQDNQGNIKIQDSTNVPPMWTVLGKFKIEIDYEEQLQIAMMEEPR